MELLDPNYFYGKSDLVVSYYQELEDYLLKTISEFLIKSADIGGKADRMLFVLQQMGMTKTEINKRLARLSGLTQKEVKRILQNSVMTSFSSDKAVLDKYFKGEYGPLKNPVIQDVMKAEWLKTCGEIENLTQTTMLQFDKDILRLLNEAEMRVATGNQNYSQAVIDVLDNYAKAGIIVGYPTGATKTLESAVRCAIVTSMNQTAAQVTNAYIAEGGIEYVIVSAHTGARVDSRHPYGLESHAHWQGKIYKIRGADKYPNLAESTGYDILQSGKGVVLNPKGLHGYNCRHSHSPAYYGMPNPWEQNGHSIIDRREQELKNERISAISQNDKLSDAEKQNMINNMPSTYELQQQQRAMERNIRSYKRRISVAENELEHLSGSDYDELKAKIDSMSGRLANRNKMYRQFCKNYKLATQADRLKVIGYK